MNSAYYIPRYSAVHDESLVNGWRAAIFLSIVVLIFSSLWLHQIWECQTAIPSLTTEFMYNSTTEGCVPDITNQAKAQLQIPMNVACNSFPPFYEYSSSADGFQVTTTAASSQLRCSRKMTNFSACRMIYRAATINDQLDKLQICPRFMFETASVSWTSVPLKLLDKSGNTVVDTKTNRFCASLKDWVEAFHINYTDRRILGASLEFEVEVIHTTRWNPESQKRVTIRPKNEVGSQSWDQIEGYLPQNLNLPATSINLLKSTSTLDQFSWTSEDTSGNDVIRNENRQFGFQIRFHTIGEMCEVTFGAIFRQCILFFFLLAFARTTITTYGLQFHEAKDMIKREAIYNKTSMWDDFSDRVHDNVNHLRTVFTLKMRDAKKKNDAFQKKVERVLGQGGKNQQEDLKNLRDVLMRRFYEIDARVRQGNVPKSAPLSNVSLNKYDSGVPFRPSGLGVETSREERAYSTASVGSQTYGFDPLTPLVDYPDIPEQNWGMAHAASQSPRGKRFTDHPTTLGPSTQGVTVRHSKYIRYANYSEAIRKFDRSMPKSNLPEDTPRENFETVNLSDALTPEILSKLKKSQFFGTKRKKVQQRNPSDFKMMSDVLLRRQKSADFLDHVQRFNSKQQMRTRSAASSLCLGSSQDSLRMARYSTAKQYIQTKSERALTLGTSTPRQDDDDSWNVDSGGTAMLDLERDSMGDAVGSSILQMALIGKPNSLSDNEEESDYGEDFQSEGPAGIPDSSDSSVNFVLDAREDFLNGVRSPSPALSPAATSPRLNPAAKSPRFSPRIAARSMTPSARHMFRSMSSPKQRRMVPVKRNLDQPQASKRPSVTPRSVTFSPGTGNSTEYPKRQPVTDFPMIAGSDFPNNAGSPRRQSGSVTVE